MLGSPGLLRVSGFALLACGFVSSWACAPVSESTPADGTVTGGSTSTGTGGDVAGTGAVAAGTGGVDGGTGAAAGTGAQASTGGGAGVDCASLPVCEDFESSTVGGPPTAAALTTKGTVTVVEGGAHSGTKAVEAKGNEAYLVNGDVLPAPGGKIYVRAYMKVAAAVPEGHVAYMAISPTAGSEGGELRFGGQKGMFHFNAEIGDGLAPDPYEYPSCTECVTAPTVGEWFCAEVMFDYTSQIATTWIDGGLPTGKEFTLDEPGDFHSSGTWPSTAEELKIGLKDIGGTGTTVYYDDVRVGYERLGCDD